MNTLSFIQNFDSKNADQTESIKLVKIRTALYNIGICWTDSASGKFNDMTEPLRVILYLKSNSKTIDYNNPIIGECNGLVLQYDPNVTFDSTPKWSILSIPLPNCTKSKVSINQVKKYNQARYYDVYEALDATIVNLYYYNGLWRVATGKGYDVSTFAFGDGLNYLESIQTISGVSVNNLDPNNCYTLAIRISDFHIFDQSKSKRHGSNTYVKLLKVINLNLFDNLDLESDDHIQSLSFDRHLPIKRWYSVQHYINNSRSALDSFINTGKIDYGYVIRSNSQNVPTDMQNLLFSSTLYYSIKHALYSPSVTTSNEIIARMVVNKDRNKEYRVMFPQFLSQFDTLSNILATVSDEVSKKLKTTNDKSSSVHTQFVDAVIKDFKKLNKQFTVEHLYTTRYVPFLINYLS